LFDEVNARASDEEKTLANCGALMKLRRFVARPSGLNPVGGRAISMIDAMHLRQHLAVGRAACDATSGQAVGAAVREILAKAGHIDLLSTTRWRRPSTGCTRPK
jgi:hypothetical protein